MNQWHIEYLVPTGSSKSFIQKWLDKLDIVQFKSIAKELSILAEVGNKLKLPHSRALGKGLFELRERRYGLRIYYCFKDKNIIILLAAGDKKSQEKDIRYARKLLEKI